VGQTVLYSNVGRIALRSAESILIIILSAALLAASSAISYAQPAAGAALQNFDWRQTARLEHEDRKNRFRRLAATGLIASPTFYEELISRKDMPSIGADLPVLRMVFAQQVFFDTDKSDLRPEAEAVLNVVAESLRKDVPDVALFVAGHTDGRGSDEYNYALSVARAESVSRYLFRRGIGLARLWRIGFGKAVPLKPNTTPGNMAENRRVEFLFGAKPEAVAVWLSRQSAIVCAGANSDEMAECRARVAAMPPIVATPVLNERVTTVEPLQKRSEVVVADGKNLAPTSESTTSITSALKRETVEIEKNSPVIIDLKEHRVTVGAPQL
jgi:outer membrane protein OmpA-like peptidoglycan-associated protein